MDSQSSIGSATTLVGSLHVDDVFIRSEPLPSTHQQIGHLFVADHRPESWSGDHIRAGLSWRYTTMLGTRHRLNQKLARRTSKWRPIIDYLERRISETTKRLTIITDSVKFAERSAEREKLISQKRMLEKRHFKRLEGQLIDTELAIIRVEGELRSLDQGHT